MRTSVRERRMHKIRAIRSGRIQQTREPAIRGAEADPEGEEFLKPERPEASGASGRRAAMDRRDPERMNDPEYVWKMRQKEWLEQISFSTDEEPPSGFGGGSGGRLGSSARKFAAQLLVSALLFALIWGLFQLRQPWAIHGQAAVREALTRDFPFAAVAAWFEEEFSGAPSFLPAFLFKRDADKVNARLTRDFVSPVKGTVEVPFSPRHPGVVLETAPGASVFAIDTGRVIFSGVRDDWGPTLVIQHADGYRSTYGRLSAARLERGDWVKAGEWIGQTSTGRASPRDAADADSGDASGRDDGSRQNLQNRLQGEGPQAEGAAKSAGRFYFAVMKDNEYLDPAEVVSFD